MNATGNKKIERIEDLEKIIDRYDSNFAYEFDIKLPNGTIVGKAGDTNAPLRRQMEWSKIYKNWFDVDFKYIGTTDIDNDTFFRDYAIHEYGKQRLGWEQVPREDFPAGEHYTQEAFYGATADNTAEAVKQLRDGIRSGQIAVQLYHHKDDDNNDAPSEPFTPRENQQVCIDNIINAIESERHHLLCAAHPRFGKSFTALYAIDKLGDINFVMVVSAVADAHDEWKDTVNLPNFHDNWVFLNSKNLANGTGNNIANEITAGKKVVLFCTLQDIEGDAKKLKHEEIYSYAKTNSFLIVDETHNGGRGATFSRKIQRVADPFDDEQEINDKMRKIGSNFGFVNQLHLSGTPYRILLTDEFAPEDIVYMASYSDLLAEKHAWFIEHPDDDEHDNPYYEFPELYNFVYNLSQIPDEKLKQFINKEGIPRLAELFAVDQEQGKFVNESVVKSFIKAIWGNFENQGCWGILSDKVLNAAVKKFHIVMKLPSIAACDAFAELIQDTNEFNGYAIIRATSNKQKNPSVAAIKQQIKAADENKKTTGTITLTCQRLSAAVSVKQWNVVINAADGKSAQDYDQLAQRACTPYAIDYVNENGDTIKRVLKPNAFVIDLVPERILNVSMQAAAAKCAGRGISAPEEFRAELENAISNTMTFFVTGIETMKQVTATNVMDLAANYANTDTIDAAVDKIPFCSALLDGKANNVIETLNGTISATKAFNTKVYENADDIDVSDKRGQTRNSENIIEPKKRTENGTRNETKTIEQQKAKQRAFHARIGYLAALSGKQHDSLDALLDEYDEKNNQENYTKLVNVTGLSLNDCRVVAEAINRVPRCRIAVDNLVYNMTRRINDKNLTNEEKLRVFEQSFARLGEAEIITPANIAETMVNALDEKIIRDALRNGDRIIELSSETGEYATALQKRCVDIAGYMQAARDSICAIPASPLAYECTRKAYELLGLDVDDIYRFTAYDLLEVIESDNGGAVARISDILKQAKKPCEITLDDIVEEGADKVEIAAIVGNPPYQKDTGKAYKPPVYNEFMEFSFAVSPLAVLITPARFLFNAGGTPSDWNEKMLNDCHFKIVKHYAKSVDVFPDVDIKGGVVVTKHDSNSVFEAVKTFYAFPELKSIASKSARFNEGSFSTIITNRGLYRFSKLAYSECPDIMRRFSDPRIAPSSFMKAKELFFTEKPEDGHEYIEIYGKEGQNRTYRWIRRDYVKNVSSLDKYKVFMPKANGSGALGEVISTPLVGKPLVGHTETFLTVGLFDTEYEANACLKYIKSKFARVLLGILKVTQSNPSETWAYVPPPGLLPFVGYRLVEACF